MSNILILNGSPRAGGNTDCLVEAFVSTARLRHHVDVLRVADCHIAPCRGCNCCFLDAAHTCVQNDDVTLLYQKMSEADVLVLASPVYFYGISAQLAAAVHRLHNPVRDSFHITKAALMLAAASKKPHVCEPIRLQYSLLLANFGIEDAGQVIAQGVGAPGDVRDTEFIGQAAALGGSL